MTGIGTLSASTTASVVYNAPATVFGTATAILTATSVKSTTQTQSVTITVDSTLVVTSTTLPVGAVNLAYSATLASTGGTAPIAWSLSSGALPAGFTLSGAGVLSGAPASAGTTSITVKATDSSSPALTATQQLTLAIAAPPMAIATATLLGVIQGTAYSSALASTGGLAPIAWSVSAGSLPAGITLSGAGVLSGAPIASGSFPFTVTATDSSATPATATQALSLAVTAKLAIPSTSLAAGAATLVYSTSLQAIGGTGPIAWAVSAGTLPQGITLSSAGVLSGTPTTAGTTAFTVKATDSGTGGLQQSATLALSLTITSLPVSITTTALAGVIQGTAYTVALGSTGGVAPITWSVSAGSLPAGITLSSAGVLLGKPTGTGTSSFTVKATDSGVGAAQQSATQALSLTVNPPPLGIATVNLAGGVEGAAYSQMLASTGGLAPIAWSLSSGTLPGGLTLSGLGVLSGTPNAVGSFTFTVKATDSFSPALTANQQLTLAIAAPPVTIATATLPGVIQGAAYSQTLASTGGLAPITWSVSSGSLPAGITLSSAGALSGTPSASGSFSFTVKATDSGTGVLQQSAALTLSITINPLQPLAISTATLPSGISGIGYSAAIGVSGGVAQYSGSIASGALPTGLTLSGCSGGCGGAFQITGTPVATGTFNFAVKVTDSTSPTAQAASQAYSITINPPGSLSIAATTLGGTVNLPFNSTFEATGGSHPYTWSIAAGALPAWASLNSGTGAISGTPTAAASSTFSVEVTDATSPTPQTATQQFTLTILAAGPNDSELKGTYAFRLGGFANGNAAGSVYGADFVGSFTADGNGNITAGLMDANQSEGSGGTTGFAETAFTGVYSIGTDNRGTVVFASANLTVSVAVGNVSGGVAQTMRLIEFDDTSASAPGGIVGSGEAKLQATSAFSLASIKGNFVFGFQGESPCTTCGAGGTTIIPYGPVSAVGVFTADGSGNITAGQEDAAGVGTSYNDITLTGSVTAPSTINGHGTITLTPAGTAYPAAPTHYAYYVVSSSEIYMMSTDSHATTTLLSGDVQLQQQAGFSNSSLSGTMVGYEESGNNGDGSSIYPNQSQATLLLLNVTGSGQLTLFQDKNSAGNITSGSQGTFTYSVEANGRMTINSTGGGTPIIYLVNNNQGFGTGQPSSGNNTPGLLTLEPQVSGPFSNTTLSGSYFFGTLLPVVSSAATSGMVTFSSGGGTMTVDHSDPSGTLSSGEQLSFTSSTDPIAGRATLIDNTGDTSISYIISPTKAVFLDTSTNNMTPTVTVIQR